MDRLSRSVRDTFDLFAGLDLPGVGMVSATEPLDHTTPMDQAFQGMMAVFAPHYVDNLGALTADNQRKRAQNGR